MSEQMQWKYKLTDEQGENVVSDVTEALADRDDLGDLSKEQIEAILRGTLQEPLC